MSDQRPSVGRVVHYVQHGVCYPAIVTSVDGSKVGLFTMNDRLGIAQFTYGRIEEDPNGGDNTWHWPIPCAQ